MIPHSCMTSHCVLLIEPVWNWNLRKPLHLASWKWTFNRTSMELKQIRDGVRALQLRRAFNRTSMELKLFSSVLLFVWLCLLIEPVWNWNQSPCYTKQVFIRLLIEPVWNWNSTRWHLSWKVLGLLIEPVWNWNFDPGVGSFLFHVLLSNIKYTFRSLSC